MDRDGWKEGVNWLRAISIGSVLTMTLPAVVFAQTGSAENMVFMVFVQGGTFTMGSPESEGGRRNDETQHQVTVSSFYIGKFDVTQELYQRVMGTNPASFQGDPNRPVEQVSWYDAVAFCNKLSDRDGFQRAYIVNGTNVTPNWSANGYRLPTEAEWEYAARGGQQGIFQYHIYAGSDNLDDVAWYAHSAGFSPHPVGQKAPNALGLYDMSGNVSQWCWDWYGNYPTDARTNFRGDPFGSYRVNRGGGWYFDAWQNDRVANRNCYSPGSRGINVGFRLVRPFVGYHDFRLLLVAISGATQ